MNCPLCLSEFRDGFTECSDCHVPLVSDPNDTRFARMRFWRGARQSKFDGILRRLDEVGVPCHFKQIINTRPRFSVFGIPIGHQNDTFEYEIWIFRSDLDRARPALKDT